MSHLPGAQGSSLSGRRVVVTGDAARVADLGRRVAALGASVVRLPVSSIVNAPDGGRALGVAATELVDGAYDWVAFTSINAVDRLGLALDGRAVPEPVRWAAVGSATERALRDRGLPCHLVPPEATADGLTAALCGLAGPAGSAGSAGSASRMLYPRAEQVRSDLAARLRHAGWVVDEVIAYRNQPAEPTPSEVRAARDADAILLTSSSASERVVELLGPEGVPAMVVTIGPSTSAAAGHAGLLVAAEAASSSADALIEALVAAAGDTGPMSGR